MNKMLLVLGLGALIMSCEKPEEMRMPLSVDSLSITKSISGKSSTQSIRFEINGNVETLPFDRAWDDEGDDSDSAVNVSQAFETRNHHVNVSILIDTDTNEILAGNVYVRDHELDAEADIELQAGAGSVVKNVVHYNDGRIEIELTR